MKFKIEFAAFKENLSAPGQLTAETTMAKTETKHREVEMEYHSEGYLVIQMKKDSKPIIVPSANIRNLVAAESLIPIVPKK